jgi:hypothetical protein
MPLEQSFVCCCERRFTPQQRQNKKTEFKKFIEKQRQELSQKLQEEGRSREFADFFANLNATLGLETWARSLE